METGVVSLYIRGPSMTLIDARRITLGKLILYNHHTFLPNILPRAESRQAFSWESQYRYSARVSHEEEEDGARTYALITGRHSQFTPFHAVARLMTALLICKLSFIWRSTETVRHPVRVVNERTVATALID